MSCDDTTPASMTTADSGVLAVRMFKQELRELLDHYARSDVSLFSVLGVMEAAKWEILSANSNMVDAVAHELQRRERGE